MLLVLKVFFVFNLFQNLIYLSAMLQAYVRRICEFLLVSYFPFFIWAAQVMKILEIFHHMMMEHLFFSCFNVVTTQYTLGEQ